MAHVPSAGKSERYLPLYSFCSTRPCCFYNGPATGISINNDLKFIEKEQRVDGSYCIKFKKVFHYTIKVYSIGFRNKLST